MTEIILLIFLPLLVALILLLTREEKYTNAVIKLSVIFIGALAIGVAFKYYNNPNRFHFINNDLVSLIMILIEIAMTIYIISYSLKSRKGLTALLSFISLVLMIWVEMNGQETSFDLEHHLFIDKLSIIMVLIIAIIGGSICVYAISYMKDFHSIHKEVRDRKNVFFSIMFIFLSAMFGIVLSNDLTWIYFFWEITTLSSFLLIKYTETKEAVNNAFTALYMNLIGGVCFAIAIIYLRVNFNIWDLKGIISLAGENSKALTIPAILIAIACFSKSAQLPFSKWILGAMVAPTPSSALLHSSTMVKAGVYLLIRISPILAGNIAGDLVSFMGGITFVLMSIIAISQNDAKKVLAYSTMANLGLITACAGIGTYESIWSAILLIIFHSVSKSLMFLSVGATEHVIGSRDIEDMHGLIIKLPEMALMMAIGIAGMFLAPFGMLISKWAALKSFIDSRNIVIVLLIAYGSAATLFYWTKWLGKIAAVRHKNDRVKCTVKRGEWSVLIAQAVITIVLCFLYPLVSKVLIIPFIHEMFNISEVNIISQANQEILTIMLAVIVVLPFGMRFLTSRGENISSIYMAGVNSGDDKKFYSAYGDKKSLYLSSWYMNNIFGEKKLLPIGIYISLIIIIGFSAYAIGGIL